MRFVLENLEGKGKSGGGLTFLRDGVHYLHGISSTRLSNEDVKVKRGMERPGWLFTDVMNDGHLSWLQRHWRDLQVQHGNYYKSYNSSFLNYDTVRTSPFFVKLIEP